MRMRMGISILLLACAACCVYGYDFVAPQVPAELVTQEPTVLIVLLVRNKAHVLPLFLSYLEAQTYPKQRIALWVRTDHNTDESLELLQIWLEHAAKLYHSVDFRFDNASNGTAAAAAHKNESSPFDWPVTRFKHLIALKEEALKYAQNIWADYIFYLDADVLLTEPGALQHLVRLNLPIVAPMLQSEGLYSNFWCGMSRDYYYLRTDEYKEIYNFVKVGVYAVPMVHSAVLINLNYQHTSYLTFDREQLGELQFKLSIRTANERWNMRQYDGAVDDIIVFAIAANASGIPLYVSNVYAYGYILPPLDASDNIAQDLQQLINLRVNIVLDSGKIIPILPYLKPNDTLPAKHKLGLDNIYMINLARRPERRAKMEQVFEQLGMIVEHFEGIDGQSLTPEIVHDMGIQYLPGYEDPYHQRAMTMGEIGCFLSHYKIWQQIVERKQAEVLVLEDDVHFEPYFERNVKVILEEAKSVGEYDLIYLGRKRLKEESEPRVDNTEHLVHVGYSYWTLGYIITRAGAQKLLAAKPLENLLPVDEYLPIMFNRHPNATWSAAYPKRNLIALSATPLLIFPTHYTGEKGYISDTESSEISTAPRTTQAQLKSDRELIYKQQKVNISKKAVEPDVLFDDHKFTPIEIEAARLTGLKSNDEL